MFDLANQSFTLLINTLLFSLFLKEVIVGGHQDGDLAWSLMGSVSLAIVALTAPIIGALADVYAAKKRILITTGICCAVLTACLAFLPASASVGIRTALTVAVLVYVPANICFNVGENILASFLPEISRRETMGRISAIGWTMGYVGALILLVSVVIASLIFGLDGPKDFRPILFFAGAWFALMMTPTALFLPEKKQRAKNAGQVSVVKEAVRCTVKTVREVSSFRDLSGLLIAFLVYAMGMQVVIFFAGVIAQDDFGFDTLKILVFSAVVTLAAGAGAISTSFIQDRIGHKTTLTAFLVIWTVTCLGLTLITHLRSISANPESFPV